MISESVCELQSSFAPIVRRSRGKYAPNNQYEWAHSSKVSKTVSPQNECESEWVNVRKSDGIHSKVSSNVSTWVKTNECEIEYKSQRIVPSKSGWRGKYAPNNQVNSIYDRGIDRGKYAPSSRECTGSSMSKSV